MISPLVINPSVISPFPFLERWLGFAKLIHNLVLVKRKRQPENKLRIMKVIIDLDPALVMTKFLLFNVLAPLFILFVSLGLGEIIARLDIVKRLVSRLKRLSNSNTLHSILSNIAVIVSSILYVLLYNLLIYIK